MTGDGLDSGGSGGYTAMLRCPLTSRLSSSAPCRTVPSVRGPPRCPGRQVPGSRGLRVHQRRLSLEGRILAVSRPGKSSTDRGIPRAPPRISFAKIREPLEVPNLLALQTDSFDWLAAASAWRARAAGHPPGASGA